MYLAQRQKEARNAAGMQQNNSDNRKNGSPKNSRKGSGKQQANGTLKSQPSLCSHAPRD
jgi:hypothetical protein